MSNFTKRAGRFSVSVAAIAVPTIFGVVAAGTPAYAGTAPATDGICNGVVNQYGHRGTVQENLLKAAARKNAELITKLQADRTALQAQTSTLTGKIATAKQSVAALEAENLQLDKDIAAAQSEVSAL